MDMFERYPRLVVGTGVLLLGGEAGFLLGLSPLHPDYLLRLLLGCSIGLILVAVPTALMRSRGQHGKAKDAFTTIVVAASAIGLVHAASRLMEPTAPDDSLQVEIPAALGVISLLGACVLLVMFARLSSGWDRKSRHRGYVQSLGGDHGYVAKCECGWSGQTRPEDMFAFLDAGDHASRVDLRIRPAES